MSRWSPQLYRKEATKAGIDPTIVSRAVAAGTQIIRINADLWPVFTLNHLAHAADVDYGLLRAIVSRNNQEPYRIFRIRKRPSETGEERFRVIAVPEPGLLKVQRWINRNILSHVDPHAASVAYAKGSTLIKATEPHCGAKWLIKLDVRNFFESITEIAVYRVFRSLGYQALISFELARLCTRLGALTMYRTRPRWFTRHIRWKISAYHQRRMGHLPQGAPTSPMLANLAVNAFDEMVTQIAERHGFIYTRYADDLVLSCSDASITRDLCQSVVGEVYAAMGNAGLSPNVTKTHIVPPGARKVVLGLLVDGPKPRLSREFKANLRQHIHYLTNKEYGPARHAEAKGFVSIRGLKHHVFGLATFAKQIEPTYGETCISKLLEADWPV